MERGSRHITIGVHERTWGEILKIVQPKFGMSKNEVLEHLIALLKRVREKKKIQNPVSSEAQDSNFS